jgi:hypothetical protein
MEAIPELTQIELLTAHIVLVSEFHALHPAEGAPYAARIAALFTNTPLKESVKFPNFIFSADVYEASVVSSISLLA